MKAWKMVINGKRRRKGTAPHFVLLLPQHKTTQQALSVVWSDVLSQYTNFDSIIAVVSSCEADESGEDEGLAMSAMLDAMEGRWPKQDSLPLHLSVWEYSKSKYSWIQR